MYPTCITIVETGGYCYRPCNFRVNFATRLRSPKLNNNSLLILTYMDVAIILEMIPENYCCVAGTFIVL